MTPDIINKATMTKTTAAGTTPSTSISSIKATTVSATSMPSPSTTSIVQRHRLTIEKLRHRVHQILKCVINLHIDILVLESNVNQLLDEVKDFNADLMEVKRLDALIETLRDYSGPTIYHEWPFPLVGHVTIEEADLAQSLNTNKVFSASPTS